MMNAKSVEHRSLRRLILRNISPAQMLLYALANFAGLAILLTAFQFYRDVNAPSDNTGDYLTLSKEVSFISAGGGGFTDEEIADIAAQPWVESVDGFTSSQFQVSAAIEMGGKAMSTYLFFESIPDRYYDIQTSLWQFDPADPNPVIPVVIPRDYLALYNFGFAASRGLPQVSEGVIGAIPVKIRMQGNGHEDVYDAVIAGFSSRINTVAVPQDFLDWANRRYAPTSHSRPERLIVHVSSPGDSAIDEYVESHNLQTSGDNEATGRMASFFKIATGLVMGVGGMISLLAFVILLLSVYLLINRNRAMIRSLMSLGYAPDTVGRYYYVAVGLLNVVTAMLAWVAMFAARSSWMQSLASMEIGGASLALSVVITVVFAVSMTLIDVISIRSKLVGIWYR